MAAERVDLPGWYARVAPHGSPEDPRAAGSPADSLQIGPITIVHPDCGCEIGRFGGTGGSAVLFDGYIFDRERLAAELGRSACLGTPDLIAAGYARWGTAIFERLEGCYLAAIWDADARTLYIGHDALGRHPVFYANDAGALWFAPNVLALAGSGRVRTDPNRLSLALACLLYWPEAGQTFFEHIGRVRPGHYLEVRFPLAVSERRYWDLMPDDDEDWLPERDIDEAFESALQQAVERCLTLGAQGIMLSGGVDSVTVAALAAKHTRAHDTAPIAAVSARTGYALSPEERMQSKVVDALGMPHVVSTTLEWRQGRDDVGLSLDAMHELPGPTHIWWVGTYMRFYRRTAAEHLTVLLTGAGGDNWLGVADAYAADLLRRLQLIQWLRFMKADVSTAGASVRSSVRRLLWASGLRPHVDTWWAQLGPAGKAAYHRRKWTERLPAWLCPDSRLRDELVDRLLARRTPPLDENGRAPRSYYRHSLRSLTNPYLYHEFETAFHVETSCGLRLLSPYHDSRLVSFLNRVPPRALLNGDRYKGLLRSIVRRELPGLGLEGQRKEYTEEGEKRQLSDLRRAIADRWKDQGFAALGTLEIVDPAGARGEIAGWERRTFEPLAGLFVLMSAEQWLGVHASV